MKKIILVLSIILIIGIVLIFGINFLVKMTTEKRILTDVSKLPNVDCILILGAGIDGDSPSLMLEDRLKAAINEWRPRKKRTR